MVSFQEINPFSPFSKDLQAVGDRPEPGIDIPVIPVIKIEKITKDNDRIGILTAICDESQDNGRLVDTCA